MLKGCGRSHGLHQTHSNSGQDSANSDDAGTCDLGRRNSRAKEASYFLILLAEHASMDDAKNNEEGNDDGDDRLSGDES